MFFEVFPFSLILVIWAISIGVDSIPIDLIILPVANIPIAILKCVSGDPFLNTHELLIALLFEFLISVLHN